MEQQAFAVRFSAMNTRRVIEAAIRAAQDLLWQNAPPMHYVADDATVARLRDLVRSAAVQAALLQSSDTFLTFVLRAVEVVVADQSQTDREMIGRLWDVLDEPHLNQALGIPQNSRIYKLSTRRKFQVPESPSEPTALCFSDRIAPVGPSEGGPSLPRLGRNLPRRGAPPAGFVLFNIG